MRSIPRRASALVVAAIATAALAGCGKVSEKISEKATEKATEKMLESALEKDGGKAKVDLSSGGAKITTTDEKGQVTVMETGNGKPVTEAELGVAIYPGASPADNATMRTQTAEGHYVATGYESKDSVEKVAGFYREKVRAISAGKQLMDNSSNDGTMLALSDPQTGSSLQVSISKTDGGSSIQIMSMQAAASAAK